MLACLWGYRVIRTPWRNYFKPEQSWTSNKFCNGSSFAQQKKAGVKPMLTSPGTGATISLIKKTPQIVCNFLPCPLRQAAKNSCRCKVTFAWHSLTPDTKPHNSSMCYFFKQKEADPKPTQLTHVWEDRIPLQCHPEKNHTWPGLFQTATPITS